MMNKWTIWCLGGGLLAATMVLSLPVQAGEPARGGIGSSAVLGMAMVGLGPLPGASVMRPVEVEAFDEIVGATAWPMPRERSWPRDLGDRPIVETRRRDEMWHTVESWDSLAKIRRDYRRTTGQLQQLNPDADLRDLEEGDKVRVWKHDDEEVAESRGDPQAGRVIHGEPVPDSDNYIVLFPHRAFGTYYAVSETVRILDGYYEAFPDADPLIVGDFSFRTGRSIHPHSSHQSGRDVDITLPRHEPPPNYNRFHHIRRDNLDAERTLWLLTTLIEGGYVEHIFLDWHHQRTLWNLAKEQGAPDEWLDEVFQYPRRRRTGMIRHEPGHKTHFHIRFSCQETDRYCY